MPKQLTPAQFERMTTLYTAIQSVAANRAVQERFDFRAVIDNIFLMFQEEEKSFAIVLGIYNSVFETPKSKEGFTADDLYALFNLYLNQRIENKLQSTKSTPQKSAFIRTSELASDANIYTMTCEKREEYINKFRLEGATNLQAAQELQAQVLEKIQGVVQGKELEELYLGLAAACETIAQYTGEPDLTLSIAIEMQFQYEQEIKRAITSKVTGIISQIITEKNIAEDVIDVKPIPLGIAVQQSVDLLRSAVYAEGRRVHMLSENQFVSEQIKSDIQEMLVHMFDIAGTLSLLGTLLSLPRMGIDVMQNKVVDLLYNSSRVELIDDTQEKDAYINALSDMFSKMLMVVVTNLRKQNPTQPADKLPTLYRTENETYMFEATGLAFAKLTEDMLNRGRLKPEDLCDIISWFSVFQRAMSGPNFETFIKIHARLQQEYIHTLTVDQANAYQKAFISRFGAALGHEDYMGSQTNVQIQKFCVNVLSDIDERIAKLRKGMKPM